jgi:hypothetical protein
MVRTLAFARRAAFGVAAALIVAIATATPAVAQCPNNCTGHGTCVPSPESRRFQCECYDGWTGAACSRRESAKEKAKAKEAEPEMIVDIPEEEPQRGSKSRGRPASGVRQFDEVASSYWKKLQPREETLLKDLGWERQTWDAKRSPRTIWPPAMHLPFKGLKAKEQSAVIGLGLTEYDWNTGKAVAILMQNSV